MCEEIKTVNATTHIEVLCHCPYCNVLNEVFGLVSKHFVDEPRVENIDQEVSCEKCKKVFIIEDINF